MILLFLLFPLCAPSLFSLIVVFHRLKRDRPLRERYERKRERRRDVTKRDERVKDDLTDGVKRAFLVHGNDIFEEFFSFGSKIT